MLTHLWCSVLTHSSVHTFRRARTWLRIDNLVPAQPMIQDAIDLALCEGLHGHARAAQKRLVTK